MDMKKSEIKAKKRRWFISSAILFAVAVGCLIGILFVWDINHTVGSVLLMLNIFLTVAGVITLSLGFAEGVPDKKKRKYILSPEDKADEEEFEEICIYDLLDDD